MRYPAIILTTTILTVGAAISQARPGSSGSTSHSSSGGSYHSSYSSGGSASHSSESEGWGTSTTHYSSTHATTTSESSDAEAEGGWGTSVASATPYHPNSSADSALASKSAVTGYSTPARFQSTQPPASSSVPVGLNYGGAYRPVYYDGSRGGNGFWDQYGTWILLSSLMNQGHSNNYYYYGDSQGNYASGSWDAGGNSHPVVALRSEDLGNASMKSWLYFTIIGLLLCVAVVGIACLIRAGSRSDAAPPANSAGIRRKATSTNTGLPEFWENVNPGSAILLSDQESIDDNVERGNGAVPQKSIVESVQTITEVRDLGKLIAFQLSNPQGQLLLIAKIVDSALTLRVYYPLPETTPGSRTALLRNGGQRFFRRPEDSHNFDPSDLSFTESFTAESDGGKVTFTQIDDTYEGTLSEVPLRSGIEPVKRALVTEYSATGSIRDPEAIVLEIGSQQDLSRSLVSIYQGVTLNPAEVQVVPA